MTTTYKRTPDDRDAWVFSQLAFFPVLFCADGEEGLVGGGEVGVDLFLGVGAMMMVAVVVVAVVVVAVVMVLVRVDGSRVQTARAPCRVVSCGNGNGNGNGGQRMCYQRVSYYY